MVREKVGYIPTLDGWRAVAIIGVFFAHSKNGVLPWIGHRMGSILWANGGHGVDLFFAISGLLICSRLLDEEKRFGRISLRGFYVRRAFRILPPAIVFLSVIGVLSLAGVLAVSKLDWFASLFFFRNYTVSLSPPAMHWWFTSHFWSLSVEEHFYLILPGVLVFLPRWRLSALAVLITAVELCKWYFFHRTHVDHDLFSFHSEIRLDTLLIPAFLAVWMRRGSHESLLR
jgi:peptidoglycan/LPS O-acetylase OafA/YrhL